MKKFLIQGMLIGILGLLCMFPLNTARAATLTVNSASGGWDGVCNVANCTLRDAIGVANATSGLDTITFNIPSAGAHTIQLTNGIYIDAPVILDASTQPGFAGAPIIELNFNDGVVSILTYLLITYFKSPL